MKPQNFMRPEPALLKDRYQRDFPYLRLSLTDVCNFRCEYCLPNGYQSKKRTGFLTLAEIQRLVVAFGELGVWKIRLTGGEPTLRRDFTDIIRMIAAMPSIRTTAFTTNGYKLAHHAQSWYEAGMRQVNVSVDSLNPAIFQAITGHDKLPVIREGIEKALAIGYDTVKINVVLLRAGPHEKADDFTLYLADYLDYIRHRPVSVRFIELMQTGDNLAYFKKRHLSADVIRRILLDQGWVEQARESGAGPAINYHHPDYAGSIGLIAPYAKDFCTNCNRLRITATGDLRLCLFGDAGVPLRDLLQADDQKSALQDRLLKQLAYKKSSHFLADGQVGLMTNFASTGG